MKTLASLGVALAVALVTAGLAAGQGASAEKKEEKARRPASRNANGTVKSSTQDSVVVAGKERGREAEWTFAVEPTTNIRKAGKAITAKDLKPGDAVQVRYVEQHGKTTAQAILVTSGRRSTASDAKKAETK